MGGEKNSSCLRGKRTLEPEVVPDYAKDPLEGRPLVYWGRHTLGGTLTRTHTRAHVPGNPGASRLLGVSCTCGLMTRGGRAPPKQLGVGSRDHGGGASCVQCRL